MVRSCLVTLSIFSLRNLYIEANKLHDRSRQLLDESTCIDSEINRIRHFIKIQLVYKGVEFINLPSIFKSKYAMMSFPTYFKIKESPIICYMHNKPNHRTIFNFNK